MKIIFEGFSITGSQLPSNQVIRYFVIAFLSGIRFVSHKKERGQSIDKDREKVKEGERERVERGREWREGESGERERESD